MFRWDTGSPVPPQQAVGGVHRWPGQGWVQEKILGTSAPHMTHFIFIYVFLSDPMPVLGDLELFFSTCANLGLLPTNVGGKP